MANMIEKREKQFLEIFERIFSELRRIRLALEAIAKKPVA